MDPGYYRVPPWHHRPPWCGAIVTVLYQLLRDQAAHARALELQERQQLFNLGVASHMANVAFDKHIHFSEQYIWHNKEKTKIKKEGKMPRDISFFTKRLLFLGVGVVLIVSFAACRRASDIDITSRSTISGIVNGSTVEGKISATFNTSRGGTSTCEFSQLPAGFTPGTFGTHT